VPRFHPVTVTESPGFVEYVIGLPDEPELLGVTVSS
jgi:hypothetical protein